jgi:hypothetical protein
MRISTPPINVATGAGHGFVVVTWDVPDDPGGGLLLGYNVYKDDLIVNTTPGANTSFVDEDVSPGEKYCYEVTALNLAGESEKSNPACLIPKWPPSKPQNLTVETKEKSLLLSWDPPEDDGGSMILRYVIYRGSSPGSFDVNFSSITDSYEDKKVTDGQTYYYAIAAVNEISEGESGNVTVVTVDFPIPELPDLLIGSIKVRHANGTEPNNDIVEGETLTILVDIQNIGTKKNDATTLRVSANGTTIGSPVPVAGLETGTDMVYTLNWTPTKGDYKITAYVDPDNKVTEKEEGNNIANISIEVKAKQINDGGGGGGGKKKTPGFEAGLLMMAVVTALTMAGVMGRRRYTG